jgi:hypothetical protein
MLLAVDYIAVDMGFEKDIEQSSPTPEIIPFLLGNGLAIVTIGDSTRMSSFSKFTMFLKMSGSRSHSGPNADRFG